MRISVDASIIVAPISFILFTSIFLAPVQNVNAQESDSSIPQDMVSSDLKEWTIEYLATGREATHSVIIKSNGMVSVLRESRGKELKNTFQLTSSDARLVFDGTRDLFNRYKVQSSKRGDDLDFWVRIYTPSGHSIRMRLGGSEINLPAICEPLRVAVGVLKKNTVEMSELARLAECAEREIEPRPLDRLPAMSRWIFSVSENSGKYVFGNRAITIGNEVLFSTGAEYAVIPLTQQDIDRKNRITRQILNNYRLCGIQDAEGKTGQRIFDIAIDSGFALNLSCNRQVLIDMKVLDELNDWTMDINERLKANKFRISFDPPWTNHSKE